ncbi:MAG: hypothetical protein KF744_05985 [Taibaiella sp.]|nr:hypothetical protein [Taibaiella sp.]
MTAKFFISVASACMFTLMAASSCRKSDNSSSSGSKLVGKWTKVRYATDDNANGKIDDWEQREVIGGITNVLEFKNDNTGGEYASNTQDLPFTWQINGEQSLMLIYSTGDTIVHKIALVNSKNLNLTYRSKIGLAEYYYTKQK